MPAATSALLPVPAVPLLSPLPATAVPTPATSLSLLDLQLEEALQLLADIPIPRTDFGVRMAFSPNGDMLLHNGTGLRIERLPLFGT